MNNGKKEYSFLWFIKNFSWCWHKNNEGLESPEFIADGLEGTAWLLRLYPRGYTEKHKGYISLFLHRNGVDGPEEFPVKCELALIKANGSTHNFPYFEHTFEVGGGGYGYHQFLQMDEVLLREKADYLPQDILSVRCRLWNEEGDLQQITQVRCRTLIVTEKISFLHVIEGFNALKPNEKKTVQIQSASKEKSVISSSVHFSDSSCEGEITVEITSPSVEHIAMKCKISLLNASGIVEKCGEADIRADATRKDISKLILSLTRKAILDNKSEYLPDNKLSLLCEYVFSTGVEYKNIESALHEKPFVVFNRIYIIDQADNVYAATQKLSACSSALDDFKSLYNNQLLSDVKLKTKTKSFSAHKIVLCARSPVFKVMLTNDMKEKNTNCIEIDDLDDDIVQQLLLFLYSDHLEGLCWETATKLYYAADKYEIEKLKIICSDFLEHNLRISTATELLLLADTHNDSDLKEVVENFILQHEGEVFGSDEWEKLIETNPQLVIKTMHLKYRRDKGASKVISDKNS